MIQLLQQYAMDCYANNPMNMLDCAFGDLAAATRGEAVLGLIFGGAIMLGFYNATDAGLATVAVLLILIGSLLIPVLPGFLSGVATTLMFLGLVAGVLAGIEKYVLEGV